MKRRTLLQGMVAVSTSALASFTVKAEQPRRLFLQCSPIAGFQFYEGEDIWAGLAVGQSVTLIRQPENQYDDLAVEVYWDDPAQIGCVRSLRKLGYLPRRDNYTISQLMDQGKELTARIRQLTTSENVWERVELDISMFLGDAA